MTNMPLHWSIKEFRDPSAINYVNEERKMAEASAKNFDLTAWENARTAILKFGRDNGRTPMQWNNGKNAGFSDTNGDTWIKLNDNYTTKINVKDQQRDEHSIWSAWKKHIAMRKQYAEIFMHGTFKVLEEQNEEVFMYTKTATDGRTALVVLNFSGVECPFPWVRSEDQHVCYLAGNICDDDDRENGKSGPGEAFCQPLRAWEGRVLLVGSP